MPILGVTALELLSYIVTFFPVMNSIVVVILACIFARVAWKDQTAALGIIVLELCIGSKGYLFALTAGSTVISIRYVLFAIILGVWAIQNYKQGFQFKKLAKHGSFIWLIFFLSALILGCLNGLLAENSLGSIFTDANGYLYLLLAPVFLMTLADRESSITVLRYAVIGIIYLSIKTLFAYIVFSHEIPLLMFTLYKWIRLSGVGEITRVNPDFDIFRIFYQSQVWMVGVFYIFVLYFFLWCKRHENTN